jgi:hypothetical protein
MLDKFLDEYELKARIAPGLILALPILVDAVYVAPFLNRWPIFAAGSVCSLALIYGLGYLVRARGQAVEASLWKKWGGPPSTRVMRYRDTSFGSEVKDSIHKAVANEFGLVLMGPSDEKKNPKQAESLIKDAFSRLRQFLRQHDAAGLWQKSNVEYGFCRNMIGCREIWVIISFGAVVFSCVHAAQTGNSIINVASAIGGFSLLCAICVGWLILPKATKRIAERYAEQAWLSFLQTSDERVLAMKP